MAISMSAFRCFIICMHALISLAFGIPHKVCFIRVHHHYTVILALKSLLVIHVQKISNNKSLKLF